MCDVMRVCPSLIPGKWWVSLVEPGLAHSLSFGSFVALGVQVENVDSLHVWSNTSDTPPLPKTNKQTNRLFFIIIISICKTNRLLSWVFFYAYFLNLFLPSQINNQVLWSLKILYKNTNMVPSEGRISSGRVLLALIDMPCLFTRAHVNNRAVGPAYMGDLAASGSSLSHCTVWLDVNKSRWGCVRTQVSVGVWKEDHKVL